jgi:hypothetical protein
MNHKETFLLRMCDALVEWFFRLAASGWIPARWYLPNMPPAETRRAATGVIHLEIVSHCWQYAHLLAYQLSSLVNYPPQALKVTMTVFFCPEDVKTRQMLEFFTGITATNVQWNWRPLARNELFRRSIGRNMIARTSNADWLWFADCDIIFHKGCLDSLAAQLQGRRDALLYPAHERITPMLADSDPMLNDDRPRVIDIRGDHFELQAQPGARGAYQIVHGDIARTCGYCEQLSCYQRPSDRWRKTYEDRAFRWLIRDQGQPVEVVAIHRIRHIQKGRYATNSFWSKIRRSVRRIKGR